MDAEFGLASKEIIANSNAIVKNPRKILMILSKKFGYLVDSKIKIYEKKKKKNEIGDIGH